MKNSDSSLFTGKLNSYVEDKDKEVDINGKEPEKTIWKVHYELVYPIESLPESVREVIGDLPPDEIISSLITETSTINVLASEDAQDAINKVKEFISEIDELKEIPELKFIVRGVKVLAEADII